MRRFQLLTAATAGKRYPNGAGNWWRDASAVLTVRKRLKNVVSIWL
ncbi:phage/conjugal plasmid C-4 type zinc finger, TraR family domain protein [Klebsiella pneumoniae JHCK1]|nr:phage/conjugal plasmid C-4 type zinc finger, TraR family domain protein [Klebsiella pneumoniae JHCK1]